MEVRADIHYREKKHPPSDFDIVKTIHEAEKENIKDDITPKKALARGEKTVPDHIFQVTLEPDDFTLEKYEVFANYQRNVHKEDDDQISEKGFKRFLCSSPLHRTVDDKGKQLGSFHQCYRLDGRLIAVGVLDLLPHAISGVYFMYHHDFEKWSFGKLSAVREACLALQQGYEYYYMGYYIHGCKKMRYKGEYQPQYVLDLLSHQWDPLDDAMRDLMSNTKYASMSRERVLRERQARGEKSNPEETAPYPQPVEAMEAYLSGTSLLDLKVPGVLDADQIREQIDLDTVKICLNGRVFETQVSCDSSSVRNEPFADHSMDEQDTRGWEQPDGHLRGIITDFAATVGPVVARDISVDFSR
jgi:arginine-tRNA-protein transferase